MKHLLAFQLGLWLVVLVVACSPETNVPTREENAAASISTVPQPPTFTPQPPTTTPQPTLTPPPTFTLVVPTGEPNLVAITPTHCNWMGGSVFTEFIQSIEEAMSSAAISGTVRIDADESSSCDGYYEFHFTIWVPDPTDATSVVPIIEELIWVPNPTDSAPLVSILQEVSRIAASGGSPVPSMRRVSLLFRNDKQFCGWYTYLREDGQDGSWTYGPWIPDCKNY